MARLVFGAVGAVAGSFFGMPQLGFAIGSAIGGAATAEDTEIVNKQQPLKNLSVQSSAYGQAIFKVYGSLRVAGNVIWSTPIRAREHRTQHEQGGKGAPTTTTTNITYTYDVDVAIGIGEGPIGAVRRIWGDGKLIYSADDNADFATQLAENQYWNSLKIYLGDELQEPDPIIEADKGVGQVPGYRGMAYVVISTFQLSKFGNRVPNLEFEVLDDATTKEVSLKSDEFITVVSGETPIHNSWINDDGSFNMFLVRKPEANELAFKQLKYVNGKRVSVSEKTVPSAHLQQDISTLGIVGITDNYQTSVGVLLPSVRSIQSSNKSAVMLYNSDSGDGAIVDLETTLIITSLGPAQVYLNYHFQSNPEAGYKYAEGFARFNEHVYLTAIDLDGSDEIDLVYYHNTDTGEIDQLVGPGNGRVWGIGADQFGWYLINGVGKDSLTLHDFPHGSGVSRHSIALPDSGGWSSAIVKKADIDRDIYMVAADQNLRYFDRDGNVIDTISVSGGHGIGFTTARTVQIAFRYNAVVSQIIRGTTLDWEIFFETIFDSPQAGGLTLDEIVSDICLTAGLEAPEFDVSGLSAQSVRGFARTSSGSARQVIDPLRQAFQFDPFESAGKIKFKLRSDVTFDRVFDADLDLLPNENGAPSYSVTRMQDLEQPKTVNLSFADINRNYEEGFQYASRLNTESSNILNLEFPLALNNTEARKMVNIILQELWQSRVSITMETSHEHLDLEPSDGLTLNAEGLSYSFLVNRLSFEPSGIEVEGALIDTAAYLTNASGDDTDQSDKFTDAVGPTEMILLDIPAPTSAFDNSGMFAGILGYLDGWNGASIFRGTGENLEVLETVFSQAVMGRLLSTPDITVDPWRWDRGNTITLEPIDEGVLTSTTEKEALAGANLLAVGQHGRWELLSFVNAVDNGDGTFTIDTLIRARKGTDAYIDTHEVNDTFVLLSTSGVVDLPMIQELVGDILTYKAVTLGHYPYQGAEQQFRNTATRLLPYSPVKVEGARDGSDNLTISWTRRTRLNGEWKDLVDVPLNEVEESYEVDVLDGAGNVLRTLASSSESVVYQATEQTTDGLTPGGPVDVKVYQLSAVVGRGAAREATV